jgi:hypothetical protein
VLGQDHLDTLSSIANLAFTYKFKGHYVGVVQLMKETVELRKRIIENNHLDWKSAAASPSFGARVKPL